MDDVGWCGDEGEGGCVVRVRWVGASVVASGVCVVCDGCMVVLVVYGWRGRRIVCL